MFISDFEATYEITGNTDDLTLLVTYKSNILMNLISSYSDTHSIFIWGKKKSKGKLITKK